MSKITKQQLKQHEKAEALLWGSDRKLNHDEVAFCLEHWDPRASSGKHVAQNQAYFTPMTLARDVGMYVGGDGRQSPYTLAENQPHYLTTFLAQHPELECHHASIDAEIPGYKSGWRGAAPLVEVVSFCDREAKPIPLP